MWSHLLESARCSFFRCRSLFSLTGGCAEYKCPRCMARFTAKASWQRRRATQCCREIAERARKVPLPGPAALQGQGLRRARAPDVLRGPRGLQHARPDGPHSAAAAGAPDSSCYVAVGRCGYVPPEELRLRLTHHERDSDKYHAVRSMLNDLLKLADHYLA